jgi:gluconokinase
VSDPHPQVVLGLDVGTTGVKVVAFGLGRPWRRAALREYPLLEPSPGQQVQDPATVLAAVEDAIRVTVEACGVAEIVAVSVSTAMHGLLGLDATMRPLTPLVTWADARAVEEARQLRDTGVAAELHQRTGVPVHPMTALAKLMWFARHDPDLRARVRWWVGLKDYVLWHLTGTLATERSSASGTGLLDRRSERWDPLALSLAGLRERELPPILAPTALLQVSPVTTERTGLAPGTPVVVGAADGPLGNVGTGAMTPGVVGLTLGTSGAVRTVVDEPPAALDPSLFCYALTSSAWVVGAAISTGGIVVRWAGSALAPDIRGDADTPRDEALLDLAASVPPGSDGLVMLPYLLAERAPLWDPDLRGAYLGLRRSHTRAHLVRAAVEGVALQLAVIVDHLDQLVPVTEVRATGGVFRSPLWREVLAAALGHPLTVVGDADGSARGAAALALLALGRAPSLTAAVAHLGPVVVDDRVVPDQGLRRVYAEVRARIPRLIADLNAVGELFASLPLEDRASTPTPPRPAGGA